MKIHYPRILNIKYKAEKFKNFKKLKLKKFKYGKLSLMTVQFSLPTFKSETQNYQPIKLEENDN